MKTTTLLTSILGEINAFSEIDLKRELEDVKENTEDWFSCISDTLLKKMHLLNKINFNNEEIHSRDRYTWTKHKLAIFDNISVTKLSV